MVDQGISTIKNTPNRRGDDKKGRPHAQVDSLLEKSPKKGLWRGALKVGGGFGPPITLCFFYRIW